MPEAFLAGLRRGAIPLVLAVACFAASWPAIEDLDTLFKGLGWILLALGAVIVVATVRAADARGGSRLDLTPRGQR